MMDKGGIVDKDVETPLLIGDLLKYPRDGGIIGVIAQYGDAFTAKTCHLCCGFGDGAGQHGAVPPLGIAWRHGASGDIDGVTQFTETTRDARADAPATAGDKCDAFIGQVLLPISFTIRVQRMRLIEIGLAPVERHGCAGQVGKFRFTHRRDCAPDVAFGVTNAIKWNGFEEFCGFLRSGVDPALECRR